MRISDWSSDVCSSDLWTCQAASHPIMKVEPSFNLEVAPLLFGLASGAEKPRCRGSRAIRGHWQRAGDGDEMEQPRSSGAASGDGAADDPRAGGRGKAPRTEQGRRSEEDMYELQYLMRSPDAFICH